MLVALVDSGTVPHRQTAIEVIIIMYVDGEGGRVSQEHVILVRILVARYLSTSRPTAGKLASRAIGHSFD